VNNNFYSSNVALVWFRRYLESISGGNESTSGVIHFVAVC